MSTYMRVHHFFSVFFFRYCSRLLVLTRVCLLVGQELTLGLTGNAVNILFPQKHFFICYIRRRSFWKSFLVQEIELDRIHLQCKCWHVIDCEISCLSPSPSSSLVPHNNYCIYLPKWNSVWLGNDLLIPQMGDWLECHHRVAWWWCWCW